MNHKPKFLSRAGRQAGATTRKGKLSERVRRVEHQADLRLVTRRAATQLHPCPECDACGLHKARCGFYLDRAKIQVRSNPNPSFNGYLGWVAKATGSLGALA